MGTWVLTIQVSLCLKFSIIKPFLKNLNLKNVSCCFIGELNEVNK